MGISSRPFVSALKKYSSLLIVIKGSPDPDAIASSFAIHAICQTLNIKSVIVSLKKIALPANKTFISLVDIPIIFMPASLQVDKFDAYVICDFQSASPPSFAASLHCAIFIDHHEPDESTSKADYFLRNTDAGSTCSLIALLLKDMKIVMETKLMTAVATALLHGIYTDTNKYSYADRIDYEALDYISKYSDHELFNKISNIPFSKKTLDLLKIAISNKVVYKDWLIAGIGYVDELNRDSIAVIADFLLKREKFPTVIVYAAIENEEQNMLTLDASFRSVSEYLNLNDIIKKITSEGGARKFKGAYQINMDYFSHCPDRLLLWDIIKMTTIELLKKRREGMYITELEDFYNKFKKKIQDFVNQRRP